MSVKLDELKRLVEELSDDRVPAVQAVPAEARRQAQPQTADEWPPPWFASFASGRTDLGSDQTGRPQDGDGTLRGAVRDGVARAEVVDRRKVHAGREDPGVDDAAQVDGDPPVGAVLVLGARIRAEGCLLTRPGLDEQPTTWRPSR